MGGVMDGGGGARIVGFVRAGCRTLLIARLAYSTKRFVALATVTAAVSAGGLFFLDSFLGNALLVRVLSTGVVSWPGVILGPSWTHFPVFCSAGLPVAAAMLAGDNRTFRALALGLSMGVGTTLFYGAATAAIAPWWMPVTVGTAWLALNGTVAWVIALGLSGAEKLDAEAKA